MRTRQTSGALVAFAGLTFLLYVFQMARGGRPHRVIIPASEAAAIQWIETSAGMELA